MVEVLTDNHNRAAADVRNIFTKHGGNLGSTGSVSRMFQRKGTIELDAEKVSEDEVMEIALEAGADDVVNEDGVITVTTTPDAFSAVADALAEKGIETLSADVGLVPDAYTAVDKSFKDYRSRVVERFGEELDKELKYNIKHKNVAEKYVLIVPLWN